jgi:hypothetical protein
MDCDICGKPLREGEDVVGIRRAGPDPYDRMLIAPILDDADGIVHSDCLLGPLAPDHSSTRP